MNGAEREHDMENSKQVATLTPDQHERTALDVAYGQYAGHLAGDVRSVVEAAWALGGNAEDALCAVEAFCRVMREQFPPWQ